MTEIQIRLDKLRYQWGFDGAAREAVVARAAEDGFNTLSIPIQWFEVEPEKDRFEWSVLDEYLQLALKYRRKVELLWFGQNSYGNVQWLGDARKQPVHLRTPDYVLHSPSPGSKATTSEYRIRRDISDYSLDLSDDRLRARESYVLGRVMNHIRSWDDLHGADHVVVGVQLDNEVRGLNHEFSSPLVISYLDSLGKAVKQSEYVVWTRMNCVDEDANSRLDANTVLRAQTGANIDFVGVDLYDVTVANARLALPDGLKNYPMITETGAEVPKIARFQLAALAGNNAIDFYDMLGPDTHGLYDRDGLRGFKPHGTYVNDIRIVNKLINSDIQDVATNAHGRGLFVHNWSGEYAQETTGPRDLTFIPAEPQSQGMSILRNAQEVVLMSTRGGTFKYPASLGVIEAAAGYFDGGNAWIEEKKMDFTATTISLPPAITVRLRLAAR